MNPKLVINDRSTGRTTDLIKASAADEANGLCTYIICHSQEECRRIRTLAETIGYTIGFPLTYDEFLQSEYQNRNIDRFYIDNLRMLLAHICPTVEIDTVVW